MALQLPDVFGHILSVRLSHQHPAQLLYGDRSRLEARYSFQGRKRTGCHSAGQCRRLRQDRNTDGRRLYHPSPLSGGRHHRRTTPARHGAVGAGLFPSGGQGGGGLCPGCGTVLGIRRRGQGDPWARSAGQNRGGAIPCWQFPPVGRKCRPWSSAFDRTSGGNDSRFGLQWDISRRGRLVGCAPAGCCLSHRPAPYPRHGKNTSTFGG